MSFFTRTKKYNANHDEKGRFASGVSAGASAAAEFEGPTPSVNPDAQRAVSDADRAAAHASFKERMGGIPTGPLSTATDGGAPTKPATPDDVRFMYNGIKDKEGKLHGVWYSGGSYTKESGLPEGTIAIYARGYASLPKAVHEQFKVRNESDSMTDYFDKDTIHVTPDHPRYGEVSAAYGKMKEHQAKIYAKRQKEEAPRDSQVEETTMKQDFSKVLKYNINHDASGRFASGMPSGTEGKNAQPPVQGPRSGESQGTSANRGNDPRTDPVKMAPAPATSVDGQDAGGTRSGDNKAVPNNAPLHDTSVSGPRSGENAGTPAVAQQNDTLTGAPKVTGQDAGGVRGGDNKSTENAGVGAVGPVGTADGPRSGENKATDGDNTPGSTGLTSGEHGNAQPLGKPVAGPSALFTNDLKRGTKVRLRNGWEAKIEDNKKGNTRLATVYGDYTEMGSVYSHDITHANVGGSWQKVTHTPKQGDLKKKVRAMGL
jgi:hypothetical protein